jgi:membrane associated rhomboid family serine protease
MVATIDGVPGMVFPNRIIVPLIPPIPMRAPVFVVVYGVLELVLGVTGRQAGVAHFAHLGGLAGGWSFVVLVAVVWLAQPPFSAAGAHSAGD